MKENYTFPAILDFNEIGVINLSFPDLPEAFTFVEQGEDYITAAQEVLALAIKDRLDSNEDIPEPSLDIESEENQKLVYINIWMPYHRKKVKEIYVKKTLTIPVWLDALAKESQINFSAVLVDGLKERLGLK